MDTQHYLLSQKQVEMLKKLLDPSDPDAASLLHDFEEREKNEGRHAKIRALADSKDEECEIDDNALVSEGDDNGAYVMAWTWVSFVDTEFDKEVERIEREEAIEIAQGWHSVMTWSDPGVTMYAFSSTGCVQSEDHRKKLLDYIDNECRPGADKVGVEEGEDSAHVQLNKLRLYIEEAPIELVST